LSFGDFTKDELDNYLINKKLNREFGRNSSVGSGGASQTATTTTTVIVTTASAGNETVNSDHTDNDVKYSRRSSCAVGSELDKSLLSNSNLDCSSTNKTSSNTITSSRPSSSRSRSSSSTNNNNNNNNNKLKTPESNSNSNKTISHEINQYSNQNLLENSSIDKVSCF
jgi:hypothetical protein